MSKSGTETTVAQLPACDFCKGASSGRPAAVDGRTNRGPWAYMCETHFHLYGVGLGTGMGQRLALKATGSQELSYGQWMQRVDKAIARKVGLTSQDLEDFDSRSCYESGMSPAEAAQECLENSDLYDLM